MITDFNAGNTGSIHDGDLANNDQVDLSDYYNATNLAAWNAAHPDKTYKTPLEWLKADQTDDGVLNMLGRQRQPADVYHDAAEWRRCCHRLAAQQREHAGGLLCGGHPDP